MAGEVKWMVVANHYAEGGMDITHSHLMTIDEWMVRRSRWWVCLEEADRTGELRVRVQ